MKISDMTEEQFLQRINSDAKFRRVCFEMGLQNSGMTCQQWYRMEIAKLTEPACPQYCDDGSQCVDFYSLDSTGTTRRDTIAESLTEDEAIEICTVLNKYAAKLTGSLLVDHRTITAALAELQAA